MQNVKAKALRDFKFKGAQYKKGDEVSMSPAAAQTYVNIGYVKLDSEVIERISGSEKRAVTPTPKRHK